MTREHEDELLPDGYDDNLSLRKVIRPLDLRGGWKQTGTAARGSDSRDPQELNQFLTAAKRLEHEDVSFNTTNLTPEAMLEHAARRFARRRRRLGSGKPNQRREELGSYFI